VRRRQQAEETAMKLPVKVLMPTMLCIVPALLIVVVGPAIISLVDTLGG
jgi:tight adherence protein C